MHTDLIRADMHHFSHALAHPVEYDRKLRRVWILGQRCHHGATGIVLGLSCLIGMAAGHLRPRSVALAATLGAVLAADDWNDRSVWFHVGHD